MEFAAIAKQYIRGETDVATKNDKSADKGAAMRAKIAAAQGKPAPDIRWVDPTLNKEQKEQVKDWVLTIEELAEFMDEVMGDGIRIALHKDERDGSYVCRFWPHQTDQARERMCLVGRGSTGPKAFRQAFYKHTQMLEEDWSKGLSAKPTEVIDD